jgi:hypothetical protein
VRTLLLIWKIHSSQLLKRVRQILAMLNPLHIIFLGMVRKKELFEGSVNLLIGQAAVVIGETGQRDSCIEMTELGPGA